MPSRELRFTKDHEWVRLEDSVATIGITQHAVDELGEIVYVDLPKVGDALEQMAEFGTVESVKTLSSLYMPISGEVSQINTKLTKDPAILNDAPYTEGWLIQIKAADKNEVDDLMTHEEYEDYLASL